MTKKLNFSVTAIEALKAGSMGDPITPGLTIERLPTGKLTWQYKRRIPARDLERQPNALAGKIVYMAGGSFPAISIGAARTWATSLNQKVENGIDPRVVEKAEKEAVEAQDAVDAVTVDWAHQRYMEAVARNEHKVTRQKRKKVLKPRTISDKLAAYERNVKKVLGSRPMVSITNDDLNGIIIGMSVRAPVQANRTGAEMRVFWKWARGIRGRSVLGMTIENDSTTDMSELWNAEEERTRWFDKDELPIFLKALAAEPERHHRRALLLLLLTGCRRNEILACPAGDVRDGMLIIMANRAKNGHEHPIKLGPWGAALAATNENWLIASPKIDDTAMTCGWEKVCRRIEGKMSEMVGTPIEHWTIHDLRRTMRSHIDDLGIDEIVCERMLNHQPTGLVKRYNRNTRAEAMAAGFLEWEQTLATIARKAGVADALDVPVSKAAETQATPKPPRA